MVPSFRRRVCALSALILFSATGCAGAAISGSGDADTGGPLKIGVIVPLTGPVGQSGTALRQGFELGVAKVNDAGGIGGKQVEFVVADDAGDPANSTQLARRLIQQDKVSVLFGTITGDTADAVTKVSDDHRIPFFTAILGDPERCSAYQWRFGESTRQLLTPMLPWLLQQHGARVAIVGSDYNYPHLYAGLAKELTQAGGGTVVAEEYSPLGQTDWQPVITRLKAANPDVLLSMVVGADAIAFSQQAQQFGLLTPELGFEGAPLDADYHPALSALTTGRRHAVRWADGMPDPASRRFVADYRAKYQWNQPIPEVAGNAYFGIQFVLAAAAKAGSDPVAINREVGSLRFDSPLGAGTHFAPENHILQADMSAVTISPDGYPVTAKFGPVADTVPREGC
ncbi:ABC transporter substrate-binding protein [Amycolatopsis sp. YIM 10]|uniref:ABC transporter substrate-binding protein n=1 Tax=Amycolatopsis sp. YIM 10 TaxID=2653857 RepID=UPI0012902CC9|nr:ABC transporter substrate-binding protein [Amycolatopsis sp. YIM 10]QFU89812.1 Aliphatic amidase expression-regulating protein [Amycolatopsis sp. YIM 10]